MDKKRQCYKEYCRSRTETNRLNYAEARNSCNAIIDGAKTDFIRSMAEKICANPSYDRRFWGLARQVSRNFSNSSFPTLTKGNGDLLSNPAEKSEAFAEYFAAVSTLSSSNHVPPNLSHTVPVMRDFKISTRAVRKALQTIDVNKSVGPDGISPIILKKLCA